MGPQPSEIESLYEYRSTELVRKSNLSPDKKKVSKNTFKQLLESFSKYSQYSWCKEIEALFSSYFMDNLNTLWKNEKESFYKEMLQKSGYYPQSQHENTNFEDEFYQSFSIKNKPTVSEIEEVGNRIIALNCSLLDDKEYNDTPFLINSTNKSNRNFSLLNDPHENQEKLSKNSRSEYINSKIERSSILAPETVFFERLDEGEKAQVNEMLDLYQGFSSSLEELIKSTSIIACPLNHFESSIKSKVKIKKIKSLGSSPSNSSLSKSFSSPVHNSKEEFFERRKKEFNNTRLLIEISDFTNAYTEFIWKYLNLYKIADTEFSTYITIEAAYGIALKQVWSFTNWIGERGYHWEESHIPYALNKIIHEQKARENKTIFLDEQIIKEGCQLSSETSPQKYLKKIVIIYRELSKRCSNADELIYHYEALFQELAKKNCHFRLFRMQLIISKLLKIDDSNGEICYAWTTWNIMIETIKSVVNEDNDGENEKEFQKYLVESSKS